MKELHSYKVEEAIRSFLVDLYYLLFGVFIFFYFDPIEVKILSALFVVISIGLIVCDALKSKKKKDKIRSEDLCSVLMEDIMSKCEEKGIRVMYDIDNNGKIILYYEPLDVNSELKEICEVQVRQFKRKNDNNYQLSVSETLEKVDEFIKKENIGGK